MPQVIGGITAIKEVNTLGERVIHTRTCMMYGQALSRVALLLLARQHNECDSIQRVTSFPEAAVCCRRLLLSCFGDRIVDNESEHIEVLHYNSQSYRDYKQECLTLIVNSQIVSYGCTLYKHNC